MQKHPLAIDPANVQMASSRFQSVALLLCYSQSETLSNRCMHFNVDLLRLIARVVPVNASWVE